MMVLLVITLLRTTGLLQPIELGIYDTYLRIHQQGSQPDSRIVLVGATEADLARRGWPLTDDVLATLLEQLTAHQPRVIGLDLYRDRPVDNGYERLNNVLHQHEEIIGVMKFGAKGEQNIAPPKALIGTDRFGFADTRPDQDGIMRRGLLFLDDGETLFYSLPLRLALRYLQAEGIYPEATPDHPDHLKLGPTSLPPIERNHGSYVNADTKGYQIMLDFQGAEQPFSRYSLSDILDHKIEPGAVQDKIVLLGVTAESVKDYFYTPIHPQGDRKMFGLALQGHITSQLLRHAIEGARAIRAIGDYQETAWIALWILLGILVGLWTRSAGYFIVASAAGVMICMLVSYWLFLQYWWLPAAPSALGFTAAAAVATAFRVGWEKNQRKQLRHLFSRYVPSEVVESVWQQRDQFMDGGRPRPQQLMATVLFSDVRGFTPLSERLDAPALMNWLNVYMESMASVVMEHGGIVDKFIGDAVMAVFGVPIPRTENKDIKQDAVHAIQCALAMEQALKRLNQRWHQEGLPEIGMRIGIYTGPLVAGSLGSSERMEYTVIGDTVNIASRLESFDKTYGDPEGLCRILIGDPTMQFIGKHFQTRKVGTVSLKGKSEAVSVYQVLGSLEQ